MDDAALETVKQQFQLQCTFNGAAGNPLLAPRGVCMHNNTLVVSDTGQNRVFIWYNFHDCAIRDASVVLGQNTHSDTSRNAGKEVTASSLQYPSGVWTNGQKLIVADAWNHRVLVWHTMPAKNGQPADVVIGQMDFTSNQPNVMGIGKPPAAHSLNWPYGVWSNGEHLWIADTGNRRVLFYNKIPTANFAGADGLTGQESYEEKEYDNSNAVWPYAVKISRKGAMTIADTQYNRVLYWKHWKEAFHNKAAIVIGQKSFQDNGQNQFSLKPAANTLNWCYDTCFYKEGIAVADTGNSRIMVLENIPLQHNAAADCVIGQPGFDINGESSLSMKTSLTNHMYWPFAINECDERLVIADTGNHRILIYKSAEP